MHLHIYITVVNGNCMQNSLISKKYCRTEIGSFFSSFLFKIGYYPFRYILYNIPVVTVK